MVGEDGSDEEETVDLVADFGGDKEETRGLECIGCTVMGGLCLHRCEHGF